MAHAAEKTVVTVEKLHDGNLLDDPVLAAGTLPRLLCRGRRGRTATAPGRCRLPDHYAGDAAHLAEYASLAATAEGFAEYLDQLCL